MIYGDIDAAAEDKLVPLKNELKDVEAEHEAKSEAVKSEDSKRREAEMREEIKALQRRRREIWGKIEIIVQDTFKNLLAEEYGLPRTHPKFDKVYSYAYEQGHSSGYSDVEIYFADIVDIIKD